MRGGVHRITLTLADFREASKPQAAQRRKHEYFGKDCGIFTLAPLGSRPIVSAPVIRQFFSSAELTEP
jgi:hypothetical protein